MFLDDSLVVRSVYPTRGDGEFPDPRPSQSESMQLQGGRDYKVRILARESYGDAQMQLVWSVPNETLAAEAERVAKQADAVVMVLGLTANLEGEEMRVQIDGFRGGDRTSIDLPGAQERLLERVAALGKPTVLVLIERQRGRRRTGRRTTCRRSSRRGIRARRRHGDRRRAVRRLQPGRPTAA